MAQLLTVKEVAIQLRVSVGTVYNWVNKNKIPFVKLGGVVRFHQDKIDTWINQRSVKARIGGMTI